MYGVEYQANAIAALLDGSFKREADDNRQFIALLLILYHLISMNLFLTLTIPLQFLEQHNAQKYG